MAPRKAPETLWHRLPAEQRAGTKLSHHTGGVEKVFEEIPGRGRGFVGHIDYTQSLFQIGNEHGKLIYWPKHLISWGAASWDRLRTECVVVEAIDHTHNLCCRLTAQEVSELGEFYTNTYGRRFGVHEARWRVFDAAGRPLGTGLEQAIRRPPAPDAAPPAAPTPVTLQGSLFA